MYSKCTLLIRADIGKLGILLYLEYIFASWDTGSKLEYYIVLSSTYPFIHLLTLEVKCLSFLHWLQLLYPVHCLEPSCCPSLESYFYLIGYVHLGLGDCLRVLPVAYWYATPYHATSTNCSEYPSVDVQLHRSHLAPQYHWSTSTKRLWHPLSTYHCQAVLWLGQ